MLDFEGKVDISYEIEGFIFGVSKTVKKYDNIANWWVDIPSMIKAKSNHGQIIDFFFSQCVLLILFRFTSSINWLV